MVTILRYHVYKLVVIYTYTHYYTHTHTPHHNCMVTIIIETSTAVRERKKKQKKNLFGEISTLGCFISCLMSALKILCLQCFNISAITR